VTSDDEADSGPYGRGARREGYPSTATAPNGHRIAMQWKTGSRRMDVVEGSFP
jgi:hypothetical protein